MVSVVHFDGVKEVILVEDKSTDNSLDICRKLKVENPKIKLHHHPDKRKLRSGSYKNPRIRESSIRIYTFFRC
ncbi:glycosyltransferase [Chryseobacterium shigense]|uniref:glycosyltransferase n=1 Tax=Chryseobacterium shigense TaxID=297244 RepID=UPI0039775CFB